MRNFYLVLLSVCLLVGACKKDAPQASLPRISQEGLDTGGFLADGVAYPATGWSGPFLSTWGSTSALGGGYAFSIPGYPIKPEYELRINSEQAKRHVTVTLFLRNPAVGEFVLNRAVNFPPTAADSVVFDHATLSFQTSNGELYSTDAKHTGRITMSRVSRPTVAAGTFEFTAVSNLDPTKTVRVTDGRFDRRQ
ncbi:DUF6252 family protein [Hymenobacter bucti]|uniref:DUF6252 family protein n=1 Tax=Hymenobacter bucti TaxID=1844114 RepID=A0ABW4QVK8_9BACT